MKNKLLSVIIPVFNSEKGIIDTLNSIITQKNIETIKEIIEVIIVDNTSTDNTFTIATSFTNTNDYIKVVKQNLIQSSYASRNFGVENSVAEYLFFIDSDMILSKDCLKLIFEEIKKQQIDYAAFNVKMKLASTSLSSKMNFLRGFNIEGSILNNHYTPTCALLVSKTVFDLVGGFLPYLESGGDFIFGVTVFSHEKKQVYFDHIELYHPTRNKYKSLISKSKRIARGNVQLAIENKEKYNYLYKRHFRLSNFMPRNPFSYQKAFKKNNISFSLKDFIISPFFHIPISFLRLMHAIKFHKKIKYETHN